MLKIYDPSNISNVIPFPIEDDMRYVTHKYSGYDTLTFEVANNDPLYKYIVEETKIEDEKNRYIVKKVDEHSDFVTVVCYVDLDDWKVNVFEEFRTTNKMLSEVLALLLPDGWTVVGAGRFSKRTTVEEMEGQPFKGANPVDILPAVAEAYSCTFQFNAINKTIEAIDPATFKPSGYFFTDELNLKNLGFVGDSTSFATRLYAFGKRDEDGNALTFASINDGKPYVEDHSYSDKIISVGWSDERYTDKENLLADAKAKLQELSYPVRSYTCDADRLGDGTWLYQIVTLIDRRRRTRVNHQVVEYKEHPNHVGDSVTLSMVAPRIESYVGKVESDLKNQIKNESYTIQQELNKAIDFATQQITGNKGGHFMWVFDSQGKPIELLNLGDTDDVSTAKQVWRWNRAGLAYSSTGINGPYTTAITASGHVVADFVNTGTLTATIIKAGILASIDDNKNFWLDIQDGSFQLGAIKSIGTSNQDLLINRILNVEYGVELWRQNENGEPYIDFHSEADSPRSTTKYDYTARLSCAKAGTLQMLGTDKGDGTGHYHARLEVGGLELYQSESSDATAGIPYIDFHLADTVVDYSMRIAAESTDSCVIRSEGGYAAIINTKAATLTAASSRRIKTNIANISEADADRLLKLRPVSFEYIYAPGETYHGLIAEEVHDVLPELVTVPKGYDPDSTDTDPLKILRLSYTDFVPYLIKLCQTQQSEIDDLKTRVAKLEEAITKT